MAIDLFNQWYGTEILNIIIYNVQLSVSLIKLIVYLGLEISFCGSQMPRGLVVQR